MKAEWSTTKNSGCSRRSTACNQQSRARQELAHFFRDPRFDLGMNRFPFRLSMIVEPSSEKPSALLPHSDELWIAN
jgi:hypothetical protein